METEKEIIFMGYLMTQEQKESLLDDLKNDILERYNNPEYWNDDIIEDFAENENLKLITDEDREEK